MFEWQCRLEIGRRGTVPADAVGLKPAGYFAPPIRFNGQVTFCGNGDPARYRGVPRRVKRSVTKTANLIRFAVNGAAMVAGFYHRSVLRCGCLAERKSGVREILAAVCFRIWKCFALSRIGYPRQPVRAIRNLLSGGLPFETQGKQAERAPDRQRKHRLDLRPPL
jgi:hypothetical protein